MPIVFGDLANTCKPYQFFICFYYDFHEMIMSVWKIPDLDYLTNIN